ncbi:MAG: phosphodiester glycosidase family protein [Capsulimonadaceae bacterium]|nr:phosphodiester glycosidase family protein [Capsulimonadaceae bacterium]
MEARTKFALMIAFVAITFMAFMPWRCTASPINVYRDYAAGVPVIIVEIDLNQTGARVTGTMASGGSGHAESWSSLIHRTRPFVAITGTYFDVASHVPVGDLFIDGRLAHFGGKGAALCIGADNRARFVTAPEYRHVDWTPYSFVIRSGPRLVNNGTPQVRMGAEGFHDPALTRPNARLGVGLTRWNRLLLVSTRERVTLSRWARALRAAGAWDAMNLDAGPCMALYVDGRTVIQPRCRLTNLMLVYMDRPRETYAHRKVSLAVQAIADPATGTLISRALAPAAAPSEPLAPSPGPREETPAFYQEDVNLTARTHEQDDSGRWGSRS